MGNVEPAAYTEEALRLVPPGYRPAVTELRQKIAKAIAANVNRALSEQLEANFPELKGIRDRLDAGARELHAKEERLKIVDDKLAEQSRKFSGLESALRAYFGWCNGEGEPEELKGRWQGLVAAYQEYEGNSPCKNSLPSS